MSACNPFLDLPEQIGYVQCSFCTTILLVSVPCSSLLKMVTVKCGHCTGLLSVSLVPAPFVPLQLLDSLGSADDDQQLAYSFPSNEEQVQPPKATSSEDDDDGDDDDDDDDNDDDADDDNNGEETGEKHGLPDAINTIVNKPPEKRQRAPSAYNQFIKEEIQRIKTGEPGTTHKEAFSRAAKNWALFPRIQQHKGDDDDLRDKRGGPGDDQANKTARH